MTDIVLFNYSILILDSSLCFPMLFYVESHVCGTISVNADCFGWGSTVYLY